MAPKYLKLRRPFMIAVHLAFVAISNYLSFWLRFDGDLPPGVRDLYFETILLLLAVRGVTFLPFRLYEGLWRYTGIWDLRAIIAATGVSSVVFYVLVHHTFQLVEYPRSVFIIDTLVLICLLGGTRLTRRFHRDFTHRGQRKQVLIYGAGDAGEMIVRDMNRDGGFVPIGFVDDDPTKTGQRIHGVEVLGTRADLAQIMKEERPQEVLVAMPSAKSATIRQIVKALEPYKISITTVPNANSMLKGKVALNQVRNLAIDDLLPRAPVGLDIDRLRDLIRGKRVLVTGAGGSIGSELSRQIAALNPAELVLYERYENSLYTVVNDLHARGAGAIAHPVIGDVTDAKRLDAVFDHRRPQVVFHAAAHKHVPMMELNPCEAVKNNIIGSRMLAEVAVCYRVDRFILISSDKAVNPSSVMGATKRVAEMMIQAMAARSRTKFAAVRFGNVLGSNGSVVLRFLEQIQAGGPVTVTHPEIKRFFMLIPEAVQLVLHAATLVRGGEIFVLEMGEQIKVLDLARNVIRLSGLVPEEEIPITFIGLRPGEKLYEELAGADETIEPAAVNKILRVRPRAMPDPAVLANQSRELGRLAVRGEAARVIQLLSTIVPTFHTQAAAESDAGVGPAQPVISYDSRRATSPAGQLLQT
jgi:FlaA1/EpsC-like NDP-sugar epimerase